ncbi:MAG: P-II family nitrogen regulator [Clostridiales Family XIII bacterium]|jgi:nitrogen regulatory protein PII|nr:P-II family nitrogen regulator [Clostridiales Family XIII bacterium]
MDTISKITIITRREKFDELRDALNEIGITGMTVTLVEGSGAQKGTLRYYRGIKEEVRLMPKIKVELIVSEVPVQAVIDASLKILQTGEIGDGKIFVSEELRVIKIRTGEEGKSALVDAEE